MMSLSRRSLGVGASLLAGAALLPRPAKAQTSLGLAFIGTRQKGPDGTIFAARFDEASGQLTPLGGRGQIAMPTWLLPVPGESLLYAVSETGNGGDATGHVASYQVGKDGSLTQISMASSAGGGATYLMLDSAAKLLFVADYGSGRLAALPVHANGALGEAVASVDEHGAGPSPRQKSAHAHSATLSPDGRFVLVPDLGADRIFIYRLSRAKPALTLVSALAFPAGSGPRRVTFTPDGRQAYALCELSAQLFTLDWDGAKGQLSLVSVQPITPPGYAGPRSGGEMLLSPDGRFLYVSVRGKANQLAVYATGAQGPREIQRLGSGGISPWSFNLSPGANWLLVANEASGTVNVFQRNGGDGTLRPTPSALHVPHPSCVAFM